MKRLGRMYRTYMYALGMVYLALVGTPVAVAAPYAAMVMDARSGEVLHSRNADTRLHPASLTKMMTLYIAFEAIRTGEITLDTKVRISANAAAEPPSKLGLKRGSNIKLRYLIRAAAIKSANDAATAIGEAISGSEAAFARRMTRTAKALGMTRTTFKNAHGLTESGHLSTARDMTILGRRILYDYPDYYNLFSRISTHAGIKQVSNTNRRLLGSYRGADGIKTGYTRAAGYNLVASAQRGNERIIATVFGGRSTATRNARIAELLDMGFKRAPSQVAVRKPALPTYSTPAPKPVVTAVKKSLRPVARPLPEPAAEPLLLALQETIDGVVAEAATADLDEQVVAETPSVQNQQSVVPPQDDASILAAATLAALGLTETPQTNTVGEIAPSDPEPQVTAAIVAPATEPLLNSITAPRTRPDSASNPAQTATVIYAKPANPTADPTPPEIVTRVSSSGGRHWGINVGRYTSHYKAERVLLKVALQEMSTLDGSLRKVVNQSTGFDANFVGMTQETADLACRRLQARGVTCFMIGPS
jgi:D-alanyl-D-alanine carboxypeptidase